MSLGSYDTQDSFSEFDNSALFIDKEPVRVSGKQFFKIAFPNVLLLTLNYLDEIINTLFIASLGDEVLIASVGLGNMTLNMIGLSVLFGLGTTLDTLLSHASGNNNLKICGEYLHQARLVALIAFVILTIGLSYSEAFFLLLNQDPRVATKSALYLKYRIPSLFFIAFFDIQKKLLVCFGKERLATVFQLVGTLVHTFLNYLFVNVWQ